jgi:hypothetical protein
MINNSMLEFTLADSLCNCIKYIVMIVTPIVHIVKCSVIMYYYKLLLVTPLLICG